MSEAAVIHAVSRGVMATLADGTVRFKIDVEPTDAAKAFAMMGMPGSPVVIALLAPGTAPADPQPDPQPKQVSVAGGPLAKLAGMWCASPEFADWLAATYPIAMETALADTGGDVTEAAAAVVRELSGVKSRAELDHDSMAAGRFNKLIREPYMLAMRQAGKGTEKGGRR